MKILNLDTPAGWRIGSVSGEWAVDLNRAAQLSLEPDGPVSEGARVEAEVSMPADLGRWLARPPEARLAQAAAALRQAEGLLESRGSDWARLRQLAFPIDQAVLAPPVPSSATVLGIGLNYHSHAAEANMEPPKFPMVFAKPSATLQGHRAAVPIPAASHRIDYEGELVVVIGRRCRDVAEADALDFVAGYTVGNDLSARDWQFRTSEIMLGKAFERFCPLGPWLVTADELPAPQALQLQTHVNGEERQSAPVGDLIFGVPFLVSYLSQVLTLNPGDVILTGTPGGIGAARQPRRWLRPGDVVEVSISGIGTLVTPLVETRAH